MSRFIVFRFHSWGILKIQLFGSCLGWSPDHALVKRIGSHHFWGQGILRLLRSELWTYRILPLSTLGVRCPWALATSSVASGYDQRIEAFGEREWTHQHSRAREGRWPSDAFSHWDEGVWSLVEDRRHGKTNQDKSGWKIFKLFMCRVTVNRKIESTLDLPKVLAVRLQWYPTCLNKNIKCV